MIDKRHLETVQKNFDYLCRQLHEVDLLPLAFSPEASPKTVFLDEKEL